MNKITTKVIMDNEDGKMIHAVYKVFGVDCINLEGMTYSNAIQFSSEYDGGSWAFVMNKEETIGFWYPLGHDTYAVSCPSNYYENKAMQALAFGASCTSIALNHHLWSLHGNGSNPEDVKRLSDMHYALREFILDLSEASNLDGAAYLGFTD